MYVAILKNSGLKVFHSDAVMVSYRVHSNGIINSTSEIDYFKAQIFQINCIQKYLGKIEYSKEDIKSINQNYLTIYRSYLNEKKYLYLIRPLFLNFITMQFKMPFKKYFSAIKHHNFRKN